MQYVDGYVLPLPKKHLKTYQRIALKAGKIWRQHGALEYRECVGEDLKVKWGVGFPKLAKARPDETVVFSWIVALAGVSKNARSSWLRPMHAGTSSAVAKNALSRGSSFHAARASGIGDTSWRPSERR